MKLSELNPLWLEFDGRRVGITFKCPCCQKVWLTCFVEATPVWPDDWDDESEIVERCQVGIWKKATGLDRIEMVPCNETVAWTASPLIGEAEFENLSFSPSLDASASGHWHGHVKNGAIK